MMSLIRLGLERNRLTVFVMLALLLSGGLTYTDLAKREEPEITIRTAMVTALFPGMPPARMETLIAEPVERKIRLIPEVEEIETLLVTGQVSFRVTLYDRYDDLEDIWQALRDKMSEVTRELPPDTLGPFVNTDYGDVSIATIAMTAEGFDYAEMLDTAEDLQRRLYTIAGISKVNFYGQQAEKIWLEFDANRLAAVGMQLAVVIDELREQNIILPSGQLNAGGKRLLLETSGDFRSEQDIAALLSKTRIGDNFVRLADIVHVRRGFADPLTRPVYANGEPAIAISVEMQSGEDILKVGKRIRDEVAAFEQQQPIGYAFDFVSFQPDEVRRSVRGALLNVAETFVVVLLVVMVFLGLRTGVVIAAIVPFAVLFALMGMRVLGIALEQVSIAAVIISLGLLVDNGVVVVEDVLRRVEQGQARTLAARAAAKQFAIPLAIASGTTAAAFLPFFLLEGPEGEYAYSLASVVALSLLGSWLSAMYFLPLIAARFVQPKTSRVDKPAAGANYYRRLLAFCLPRAPWVLAATALLVVAGALLFSRLPSQLFPPSDRGEVLVYMELPMGSNINETLRLSKAFGDWLADDEANPELRNYTAYIADGGPRFYLTLNPAERSPTSAFFLLNTADMQSSLTVQERVRRHAHQYFPEARFTVKRLAMGAKESGVLQLELTGPDADRLLELARDVEAVFYPVPAMVDNRNDWGEKIVKVMIDVDQNKARRLGVSSASLSRVLSAYFDGSAISVFHDHDRSLPIVLRASEKDRDSIDDLRDISVLSDSGAVVPLGQLAVIRPELEFSQLRRNDQQRMITITAKSEAFTAEALLERVQNDLDSIVLPEGYSLSIAGEIADSHEIYGKLAAGLPAAFALMVLLVVFQFNSFRRAAIVFTTVPLVIIGAPLGLMASGQPLSFMGTLGLISLAGIIINNAIVLIDQIDIERANSDLKTAIIEAAQQRFRPILLTSVTTVVGLLPLFFFGGPLWTPLAAVIIGGLSLSSVLSLVFVPASYYLLKPPVSAPSGNDGALS
ncbi:MAG: efflux RND transporter permease subunit [Spongiibacter marinus]|uniref:efflux RND transporter permease subunit n=1 Tax=Spongiibacter marinus TaxID=354246 RepID=UPI003C351687